MVGLIEHDEQATAGRVKELHEARVGLLDGPRRGLQRAEQDVVVLWEQLFQPALLALVRIGGRSG